MASIVFDHVSKQFSDTSLNDCTVEIKDQDFFVFIGPSGCGKSTALRCLQGLLDIDSGRILIDGQDVSKYTPMQRNLRSVGGSSALYPELTVFENMAYGLKKHNLPESDIAQQVQDVAEKLGIESLLKHKPNQLTKLQRHMVVTGRVMLQRPAAFIFESQLLRSGLIPQESLWESIVRLYRVSGLTCITATDNAKVALNLATRIAILKDGILQQVDTPQNLIRHPANAFVSELIRMS